jgi:hypothetical protein
VGAYASRAPVLRSIVLWICVKALRVKFFYTIFFTCFSAGSINPFCSEICEAHLSRGFWPVSGRSGPALAPAVRRYLVPSTPVGRTQGFGLEDQKIIYTARLLQLNQAALDDLGNVCCLP